MIESSQELAGILLILRRNWQAECIFIEWQFEHYCFEFKVTKDAASNWIIYLEEVCEINSQCTATRSWTRTGALPPNISNVLSHFRRHGDESGGTEAFCKELIDITYESLG